MAEVALEEAPRKAREHFEKGFAALERGNIDYAMDMFFSALDLCPGLLRARKFLRAAEIRKSKGGKISGLTHALSTLQGLPAILQFKSQLKKKPDQALKTVEQLLRKDPLNMTFINMLDQAAIAADMPEVAAQTLEIARDHYPGNVKLLQRLGQLYQDTNRMREAREAFEQVVRMKPNDPMAMKSLKDATALDSITKGGWAEAGSYRDVMKDSKEAVLLEQEAKAVKTTKDSDDLISEFLSKIEREPQNVNYKKSLADLYARSEQFDKALQVLQEAQKASGGSDPQIDRALSNVRLQKLETELAKLKAAGDTAGAQAKQKERDSFLLADAEDRVKRYPNELQFRYDLGVLQYELGRLNEAIQQFQLSQRHPQRRVRSLYYLALCFKQKQQYDIAVEQLEKAASELTLMDETKKDILYELGTTFEAMGQMDKAAAHYKEIYSVDISYRDIAQKIEKAYKK